MRMLRGSQKDVHVFRFGEQILGSESRVCNPGFLSSRLRCYPLRDWPSFSVSPRAGHSSEPTRVQAAIHLWERRCLRGR